MALSQFLISVRFKSNPSLQGKLMLVDNVTLNEPKRSKTGE